MTTVVLVRHGESLWNAQGRIQGQAGTGLSPFGMRQAEVTAEYLSRRYAGVTLAVRSDQERVAQTAQPFEAATGVDTCVDTRWREIDVGTWSGLTWDEVAVQDPDTLAGWRAGNDVRRGGGETFAEMRARACAALEDLRDAGGTVIVFSHGGAIRLGVAAAIGVPVMGENALSPLANCSVTELVLEDGGYRLAAYNVRDHVHALSRSTD